MNCSVPLYIYHRRRKFFTNLRIPDSYNKIAVQILCIIYIFSQFRITNKFTFRMSAIQKSSNFITIFQDNIRDNFRVSSRSDYNDFFYTIIFHVITVPLSLLPNCITNRYHNSNLIVAYYTLLVNCRIITD